MRTKRAKRENENGGMRRESSMNSCEKHVCLPTVLPPLCPLSFTLAAFEIRMRLQLLLISTYPCSLLESPPPPRSSFSFIFLLFVAADFTNFRLSDCLAVCVSSLVCLRLCISHSSCYFLRSCFVCLSHCQLQSQLQSQFPAAHVSLGPVYM